LDWNDRRAKVGGVLRTATLSVNRYRASPRGARLPVRLKARLVREVEVLFRHALSGL
jgi:hypothetical protein